MEAAAPAENGPNFSNKSSITTCHVHLLPHHYGKLLFKSKKGLLTLLCTIALIVVSYAALASVPSYFFYAPFQLPPQIRTFFDGILHDQQHERKMKEVLERAAMPHSKTVIITTLNSAWAKEGTMIDIFLESFWHGHGTRPLLQHLVLVCVDAAAYERCLVIHPHCLFITTPGVDFSGEQLLLSGDYIKLMWRRIKFLQTILQMNYSFVFTDTDVLWFRNPFPQLEMDPQADFQIACDLYNGKPSDLHNSPNAGFTFAHANERTIRFYEYWYEERKRGAHMADQEVLNSIKFEHTFASIGLNIRFLDTQYFGGFCALRTTNMTKAITMHATCCKGLDAKLIDLRAMLEEWKKWAAQNHTLTVRAPDDEVLALMFLLYLPNCIHVLAKSGTRLTRIISKSGARLKVRVHNSKKE
ncbi:hypothetical protein GOP47_0018961 [Adiantum capillus-veneris]|uniref:Nucleotide-diphospho-sugar transferase domain-containing protein n=1 Tax=Adiantum capillus-veneris TaxID=13818 RepID=A0A9D4ZA37_ADICA|nr:hypothetical protein GOP47_0018961 [Adiantum capillus-veneris]